MQYLTGIPETWLKIITRSLQNIALWDTLERAFLTWTNILSSEDSAILRQVFPVEVVWDIWYDKPMYTDHSIVTRRHLYILYKTLRVHPLPVPALRVSPVW